MMRIALIVNNPTRDLSGLVLLSYQLSQRGATCYLIPGPIRQQEIGALAPDLLLQAAMRGAHQDLIRRVMNAGIKVGVLDNEGGIFTSFDWYSSMLHPDPSVRHRISFYCSWGTAMAEQAIKANWYREEQVTITGHPRFDFYAPQWRAAILETEVLAKSFPGPLILINGAFAIANPGMKTPQDELVKMVKERGYSQEEAVAFQNGLRQTLLEMVKMTNHLASRFPHVNFVYRPHPFERLETYQDLLDKRPNLHLVKHGTVDRWLSVADAVIQRSCTTAVEAGMLGLPALTPSWIHTPKIIKAVEDVSVQLTSQASMDECIDTIVDGSFQSPAHVKKNLPIIIRDWFYAVDGESHRRVADMITSHAENSAKIDLSKCRELIDDVEMAPKAGFGFRFTRPKKSKLDKKREAWDQSEKFFDASQVSDQVSEIVNSLEKCNSLSESNYRVGVRAASHRDDYRFPLRHGRSIAIFPKSVS